MRRLALLALALAAACSDALEQTSSAGQVIGVVKVSDLSLVSATDFSVTTRSWPGTTANPTTIAGRGRAFVVTLEQANAVGVSLLVTCPPDPVALCGRPDYVLPLRAGSEPDGVAIQDDSIAIGDPRDRVVLDGPSVPGRNPTVSPSRTTRSRGSPIAPSTPLRGSTTSPATRRALRPASSRERSCWSAAACSSSTAISWVVSRRGRAG